MSFRKGEFETRKEAVEEASRLNALFPKSKCKVIKQNRGYDVIYTGKAPSFPAIVRGIR